MALIELHPDVDNYILKLSLPEIEQRGGIADLVEVGKIVIIDGLRLDADFEPLDRLSKSTEGIADPQVRRHLKKLESTSFFQGRRPRRRWGKARFDDPIRQALFSHLCHGDLRLFEAAAGTLRKAHKETLELFQKCFAGYDAYRLIPSIRLTRTLFENLHWDEHWIAEDFHAPRIFANLDRRPRIWHLSHRFPDLMRRHYQELNLGRFAGRDPNELLSFINGSVLGGASESWKDRLPRHRVAFEPGEVWVGESRLISHQIYYGEAALVYMWFVRPDSMANPANRFDAQVARIHAEMGAVGAAAATGTAEELAR